MDIKSRQLLFQISDKIKNKEFDENYIYFASLILSWINTNGNIFLNIKKYEYYGEDSFTTFLNLWKKYFSQTKDCKQFLNKGYICEINNKKNNFLLYFIQLGINFPYKFKNNFIDYGKINVDEIIDNIKKIMTDIYCDNLYCKSNFDDYSFVKNKNNDNTKFVINNNAECCIYLGKPKFHLFSFKSIMKGDNFFVLDKIMSCEL